MLNNYFIHKTKKGTWGRIILLTGALFAFIEWSSNDGISIVVGYGLFAFGVLLLFIRARWGILLFFAVCLLSTDTRSVTATEGLVSVHTISIGGFSLMVIWTLLVLFVLLLMFLHRGFFPNKAENYFDRGLIYLGGLFICASLVGIGNLIENPRMYISDLSYFINMAVAYFAVRLFFRGEKDLNILVILLVCCIGVRAIAGMVYYLLGFGAISPHVVKPVMDSSRNLFHFLPILAIAVLYFRGIYPSTKNVLLVFAIVGTANVLFYASRGNLILLTISIILLSFILAQPGCKNTEVFQKLRKISFPIFVLILFVIVLMHYYRPGSLNYVWWKMRSTIEIDYIREISSAGVRWLEAENIVAYLWHNGTILWGQGLGGWFVDDYIPFATELLGGWAFPDEWILQNKLYKPHGSQLWVLLKMGVLGTFVYFGILLWIFVKGWNLTRHIDRVYWRAISSASVVFLLTLYYKNFTSKLQIFLGILLGIIANIYFLHYRGKASNDWMRRSFYFVSSPQRTIERIYH